MADACVLGPDARCHVVCRGWTREVVLCRRGDRAFCRAAGRLEIDGLAREWRGADRGRLAGRGRRVFVQPGGDWRMKWTAA